MRAAIRVPAADGCIAALAAATRLTHDMLRAGRRGDWPAVLALHAEREPLLRGAFQDGVAPEAAPMAATMIRTVLELDRELCTLGRQARDLLRGRLQEVRTGSRAARAYA
ncbi:MAG: flagellar protein FliT [Gammaproteobacteria bacterium]